MRAGVLPWWWREVRGPRAQPAVGWGNPASAQDADRMVVRVAPQKVAGRPRGGNACRTGRMIG
ncbi:hypothetical protein ACU639_16825 [Streptomyces cynarae]|uniref:hypothetical protein n=1 Tax=Streptomyces cynarae TaxID=2981134 RepID=UPI00406CAA47